MRCPSEGGNPTRNRSEEPRGDGIIRRRWSQEEDQVLFEAVRVHGACNWERISRIVGSRKDWQCRERWNNHLRPGLDKRGWSAAEDTIILSSAQKLGHKWSAIARTLPGRSTTAVKNRFYSLRKHNAGSAALSSAPGYMHLSEQVQKPEKDAGDAGAGKAILESYLMSAGAAVHPLSNMDSVPCPEGAPDVPHEAFPCSRPPWDMNHHGSHTGHKRPIPSPVWTCSHAQLPACGEDGVANLDLPLAPTTEDGWNVPPDDKLQLLPLAVGQARVSLRTGGADANGGTVIDLATELQPPPITWLEATNCAEMIDMFKELHEMLTGAGLS